MFTQNLANTSLQELRPALVNFALLHLTNPDDAEECVQETMLAVLAAKGEFANKASYKTYVFSILKNKIADCLRHRYRSHAVHSENDINEFECWFESDGHWATDENVTSWDEPADELAAKQFLSVLSVCMHNLPAKTAQIFSLKEFMDFDPETICRDLDVSKDVYWQSMSRARKTIQTCLNIRYFGAKNVV